MIAAAPRLLTRLRLRGWIAGVMFTLGCLPFAAAHKLQQVVVDLELGVTSWTASSEFEALYAVDDLIREVVPASYDLSWLNSQDAELYELIKAVTESFYRERFQILEGEGVTSMEFSFPDYVTNPPVFTADQSDAPVVRVVMRGDYQETTGPVSVRWNASEKPHLILRVASAGPQGEEVLRAVKPGETVELARPAVERAEGAEGAEGGAVELPFADWVKGGYRQILPKGLPQVLFLLGLFLLVPRWKPLLTQSAAFTVAHLLTLGLVIGGVFSAPAAVVEPLVALSVAWVGIDNLFARELKPWRLVLVFGFGLAHGIGFANAMRELPLPSGDFAKPLFGFHLGIELGQIAVLAIALLIAYPFLQKDRFQSFRTAASALITAAGVFWLVAQLLG